MEQIFGTAGCWLFFLSKLSKMHKTLITPGTQSNVPLQGKNTVSMNIQYKERYWDLRLNKQKYTAEGPIQ
jgi:hypothetical protein